MSVKGRPIQDSKLTRLGRFMRDRELGTEEVADLAGISRQHLYRLKVGDAEPTRPVMIWLTIAARRLSRTRVRMRDLFDLGDEG